MLFQNFLDIGGRVAADFDLRVQYHVSTGFCMLTNIARDNTKTGNFTSSSELIKTMAMTSLIGQYIEHHSDPANIKLTVIAPDGQIIAQDVDPSAADDAITNFQISKNKLFIHQENIVKREPTIINKDKYLTAINQINDNFASSKYLSKDITNIYANIFNIYANILNNTDDLLVTLDYLGGIMNNYLKEAGCKFPKTVKEKRSILKQVANDYLLAKSQKC